MQRDSETNCSDRDFLIYQKGFALSATQALDLEEQLVANPEFISHRLQLIGYFTQNAQSFETLSRWTEHVTWMIQYCPEDWMTGNFSLPLGIEGTPALLVKLSRAWQCTLASFSNNAQVIGRAGQFFASLDFDKSIELLEHAESLDEKSSIWPRSICNQYFSRVSERKSTSDYELAIIHGNQALSREKHRGQKYDLLLRLSYLSLSFNDLSEF
jgi:hypothetical protein